MYKNIFHLTVGLLVSKTWGQNKTTRLFPSIPIYRFYGFNHQQQNSSIQSVIRPLNNLPKISIKAKEWLTQLARISQRPCHNENTSSYPIIEVKQHWARILGTPGALLAWVQIFFLYPYYPLSSCQAILPLISAPSDFLDWGLVTRWAQLLNTSLTITYGMGSDTDSVQR